MALKVVRVLAVADASVLAGFRRALTPDSIELVATGSTPLTALAQLRRMSPDVVVLDLGLTQTDVYQLLTQLVHEHAGLVLALTSGPDAVHQAERAWAAGASDVIERPGASPQVEAASSHALALRIVALAATLRPRTSRPSFPGASMSGRPAAAMSKHAGPLSAAPLSKAALQLSLGPRANSSLPLTAASPSPKPAASLIARPSGGRSSRPARPLTAAPLATSTGSPICLLAIGASTGGTLALTELLSALPANSPPVLVVQHMLAEFTHEFAERLNAACVLDVREAIDKAALEAGCVLIAPGGQHLRLARDADRKLCVRVTAEAPVNKHRPSVDVLFRSCAEVLGAGTLGVLLTGMGDDGARGLLALRNTGAHTLVQDQASSACFGMPSAAIALGAAQQVLSLREIARALQQLAAS